MIEVLLLISSVTLSSLRGLFSKELKDVPKYKAFFFYQGILFFVASIIVFAFNIFCFVDVSYQTILLGLLFGAFLVGSQWLYTIALSKGLVSICSMVYSFGFIIPTIFGFVFWNEEPSITKIIGIILIIPLIFLISFKGKEEKTKSNLYLIPLFLAALCSGSLGVMQKVQQRSDFADQRIAFLLVGMLFSCLLSFLMFAISKKSNKEIETKLVSKKPIIFACLVGLSFGLANIVNLYLAGKVAATILFPIQNIGTIVLTTLLGYFVFKERPKIKELLAFLVAVTSIVLIVL